MPITTIIQLFVFMLAGFVGVQTINRIPPLLHTPLMAATNAISGISLVASLVLAGSGDGVLATVLGTTAVGCAMAKERSRAQAWQRQGLLRRGARSVRGPKDVDVIRRCPAITLRSRLASQRGLAQGLDESRHTVFNSEGY
jgi:H+-translocating NAD(P) transhydrogenase subunit alpha